MEATNPPIPPSQFCATIRKQLHDCRNERYHAALAEQIETLLLEYERGYKNQINGPEAKGDEKVIVTELMTQNFKSYELDMTPEAAASFLFPLFQGPHVWRQRLSHILPNKTKT